jgi:hypothetical protein
MQNLYQIKEKALIWCRYGCNYNHWLASSLVDTGYLSGNTGDELQSLALELRGAAQVKTAKRRESLSTYFNFLIEVLP